MIELGVNVDIDRIKFLSREDPLLKDDLSKRVKLWAVDVAGVKYLSWIVYFDHMVEDHHYFEQIKAIISSFTEMNVTILLSGNGLDANKVILSSLFGSSRFETMQRQSQVKGITQGLKILIRANVHSKHFYCLKGQNLLDIKSIKYSPEIELPSNVEFPLLIINIKGGITFYKMDNVDSKPHKVLASIFGEFSLAGLMKLIDDKYTGVSINHLLKRAIKEGSNMKVDLTVGDIYGEGINQVSGLHKDIIASSMGKARNQLHETSDMDYILSSIVMFAINTANISSLVVVLF